MTHNERWANFDEGTSIGSFGSEGGQILEDVEFIDGARVTIEKGGSIAPYSVTLGIYGLMFHTHFCSTETEGEKFMEFAIKKIDEIFSHNETPESEQDQEWYNKYNRLLSELAEQ